MLFKPSVGLDIGSVFARAVALRRTRDSWMLAAAGQAAVGASNGDIGETVKRVLADLRVRRANLAVAVPAESAIVRRLTLSVERRTDLAAQIAWEIEGHMPAEPDEASVSYQVLEHSAKRGRADAREVDVLVAAVKRSAVADRAALVTGGGRRVSVADVEGLALANAFVVNYPEATERVLIVHLGARSTVICLLERGAVVLTRGITATADTDSSNLVTAIRQAVANVPKRVLVSGGGWQMSGLPAEFSSDLGSAVEPFDPVRRIRKPTGVPGADIVGPPFALAVGLALRRKGDW